MTMPDNSLPKPAEADSEKTKQALNPAQRKLKKLKNKPVQFVKDSKAYTKAKTGLYLTRAKLGSFALVVLLSIFIVVYYTLIASPRYVSETQFVVKQAAGNEIPLPGLASLAGSTSGMRDALILKRFIESREMAVALDNSVALKAHYENSDWDTLSRLQHSSTVEDYVEYYKQHILVFYDEMSDVLRVEVQTFDREYSLMVAQSLLKISEKFINDLGAEMVDQQTTFAREEVERSYQQLKKQQTTLIAFQDEFQLYNPEQQGSAVVQVINELEAKISKEQAELKSLQVVMRSDSSEVRTKKIRIDALQQQLAEEKERLTQQDKQSLNKINVSYQKIQLETELAADIYKSSLASLESVRIEAYKKLKHLLIIEYPALSEEDKYPRRIYNIVTWFVVLILLYLVIRLIVVVIKEHRD